MLYLVGDGDCRGFGCCMWLVVVGIKELRFVSGCG